MYVNTQPAVLKFTKRSLFLPACPQPGTVLLTGTRSTPSQCTLFLTFQ